MYPYPQVLLLGNGMNRAFGGASWNDLLKRISVRDDFDIDHLEAPMPLQAILVTNNNIKDAMKAKQKDFMGRIQTDAQRSILRELLGMGFDDILTTNYSYELEAAALGQDTISEYKLAGITERTSDKREIRYLLHTYKAVPGGEAGNRIWHIHGESRFPDSMLLGHYWYGNLLGRMKAELDSKGNRFHDHQVKGLPIKRDSWIDSFILGDVYVLGFGFNLTEFDLWWLLNRKKREKADIGRIIFYEPANEKEKEKVELLRLMDVCVRDLGYEEPAKGDPKAAGQYQAFYKAALHDIKNSMNDRKVTSHV